MVLAGKIGKNKTKLGVVRVEDKPYAVSRWNVWTIENSSQTKAERCLNCSHRKWQSNRVDASGCA